MCGSSCDDDLLHYGDRYPLRTDVFHLRAGVLDCSVLNVLYDTIIRRNVLYYKHMLLRDILPCIADCAVAASYSLLFLN